MTNLESLLLNSKTTSWAIQRAIRETDSVILEKTMLGLGQSGRDRIFENMSKRSGKMLQEGIAKSELLGSTSENAEAESFFHVILTKMVAEDGEYLPLPDTIPQLKMDTATNIVKMFGELATFIRDYGVLGLEKAGVTTDHQLMKKGLQYLIDGWDPMWSQSMLENFKEHYLKTIETEYDMIIEGISMLYQSTPSEGVKEKLKSICGLE